MLYLNALRFARRSKINFDKYCDLLEDGRVFRRRHVSAIYCQKMWRGFFLRRKHQQHLAAIVAEEQRQIKAYRDKLRDKRKKSEAAVVFKKVRVVQGITSCIVFSRKDNRRQSCDYGIIARVYLPVTQETFKFVVEEDTLREFIEQALEIDGLSANEMMTPEGERAKRASLVTEECEAKYGYIHY